MGETLNDSLVSQIADAIKTYSKQNNVKRIVIGQDSRPSGLAIVNRLREVLHSETLQTIWVGIVPTSALAFLTRELGAELGIMITASHNPPEYNGVKIFDSVGQKMGGEQLKTIDNLIHKSKAQPQQNWCKLWEDFLVGYFSPYLKKGGHVVIDAAFGSGGAVAVNVLKRLGYEVTAFNTEQNGIKINDNCGATSLGFLCDQVSAINIPTIAGFAFDGDADRCVVVNEHGKVVHGDVLLALLSRYLETPKLVTTVMFNTGVQRWLESHGIEITRTKVGDSYVIEAMQNDVPDAKIGGETSGHIIFPDVFVSGDGLVTALMTLAMLEKNDLPVSKLCKQIPIWHSILKNVQTQHTAGEFWQDDVRVLIRKSGTENVTRIFVEGADIKKCEEVLHTIIG